MNNSINKNLSMESIIKGYSKNIQSLIKSFNKNIDSDEIEQEVYIKLWKNLTQYKEEGKIWNWIKRITINTCKDKVKSKHYKNNNITDFDSEKLNNTKDDKYVPELSSITTERHKEIINAVELLKPKLKEVIVLYDMYGFSYEEISKKINSPVGTVKSRIFNARKELKNRLHHLI